MKKVVKYEEGLETRHLKCLVKRLIHPHTTGSVNLGLSIAILQPGEEIPSHSHGFEEAYFVAEGGARMRIGDDQFDVVSWDSVYVPSDADHWTLNTGEKRLVLICALSPPPKIEAY